MNENNLSTGLKVEEEIARFTEIMEQYSREYEIAKNNLQKSSKMIESFKESESQLTIINIALQNSEKHLANCDAMSKMFLSKNTIGGEKIKICENLFEKIDKQVNDVRIYHSELHVVYKNFLTQKNEFATLTEKASKLLAKCQSLFQRVNQMSTGIDKVQKSFDDKKIGKVFTTLEYRSRVQSEELNKVLKQMSVFRKINILVVFICLIAIAISLFK